jgi:hypothetical protein
MAGFNQAKVDNWIDLTALGHQWIWKADDLLRGLKLRVPIPGILIKLIPTEEEIESCREFGQNLALDLLGLRQPKVIDMADLA